MTAQICDVRYGSLATDLQWPRDVRFAPESDQIAAPTPTVSLALLSHFMDCGE